MIYRTEVDTGSGGFGYDNLTLRDALNDIYFHVSSKCYKKFKKWFYNHKNNNIAKFKFENLKCDINKDYCYIVVGYLRSEI